MILPEAVCALITNPKTQKILLVSRKDDPTNFGLPGGKVDPDETLKQAICREVKEETGLIIKPNDVRQIYETVCLRHAPEGVDYYAYGFVANSYQGSITTQEEGVVQWGTWEDLDQGSFAEYNRGFRKAYLEWKNN